MDNDNSKASSRRKRRRTKEIVEETAMLAERIKEWPSEWRREGFKKGYGEGFKAGHKEEQEEMLAEVRILLLHELETRFGDLPPEARMRMEALVSFEKIVELTFAIATVPDLAALGLC